MKKYKIEMFDHMGNSRGFYSRKNRLNTNTRKSALASSRLPHPVQYLSRTISLGTRATSDHLCLLKPSLLTLNVIVLQPTTLQTTPLWSLHMSMKSLHNLQPPTISLNDTLHLHTNLFSTTHILPGAWDSLDYCESLKPNSDKKLYVKGFFNDRRTRCRVMLGRYWLRFHMHLPRLKYNNNFRPLLASELHLLRDYLENLKRVLGLSFDTDTLTPVEARAPLVKR